MTRPRTARFVFFCSATSLLALLLFGNVTLAQTGSLPTSLNLADPKLIANGQALFAKGCSVGYCHGAAGRAGRGPRLRGREWDPNYLFKVTFEGIPNSSMPAWKDRLTENEIGSIVAYILTLSKLKPDSIEPATGAGEPPASASAPAQVAPQSSTDHPRQAPSNNLLGDPEKGRALFFDSSNDLNCGACHKVGGTGSDVGPDLSQIRQKQARDILKDILLPSATLSLSRQLLKITSKTGEQIQGVKLEESATQLKIYDMEGLPPVLRTLAKEQIQTAEVQNRSAMPAKYGDLYTVKQLLDIIAFIKKGDSAAAQVSVDDLF